MSWIYHRIVVLNKKNVQSMQIILVRQCTTCYDVIVERNKFNQSQRGHHERNHQNSKSSMLSMIISVNTGGFDKAIKAYKQEEAMKEKKYNNLQIIKVLVGENSCDSISCSKNLAFGNLDCPLKETGCDFENIKDKLASEYNGTGMNDDDTPFEILELLSAGIHPSVKWLNGTKTLHGKCVAVIDGLAIVVSKKDPSKVVKVSVDRLFSFM